jgi:branched-chain amino acid transport system substrate-binding protein
MKKLSKLAVFLLLFSLVLAACREAPVPETVEPTSAPAADPTDEPESGDSDPEPTVEPEEDDEPMAEAGPIKVGFMGPLTGGAAFIGQEQLGFVKVAVEIFNARTGLNVEVVEGDTEINPDTGRIVAERFAADEEMIGVVGPAGSQVCESTQPVFAEANLAHITPSCTRTDLTTPGTATFFRPIPTDAGQSATDAEYMATVLGATNVYLLDDQSSYSVGLNDEMEVALNDMGVATERASVSQEETDFSSVATAVTSGGFDAVFFPSQIVGQEATLAIQLREQGYSGIYFLADGGFSSELIDTAGEAVEGAYVSFFSPDPNLVPEAQEYNEMYAAQYGEEFGAFGGAAGLAAQVMLEAIERCANANDVTRACVVTELGNTDMATSMLGIPVKFGEGNQAGGGFSIFQVQAGSFNLLAGDDAGVMMESNDMIDFEGTIKMAFLGPLTGGAAFIGQEQLGFVKVTVDLFNQRTGLNVEVVEGDDEINPDVGRVVAERVAADADVFVVVGPAGSQVCESTKSVFTDAGLANVTPSCTRTDLTAPENATATFFRPIPTDAAQSQTIADYALNTLGSTSAFLVDDQSSYSVGLNDEIEVIFLDAGISVERASVSQEETDFSSIATNIVGGGFDLVIFPSQIVGQESTLAIQLQEQGYEGVYFLADGGFSPDLIDSAGDAVEGAYVTFFAPDPNLVASMTPYNEAYSAAYGEEFGAFGGAAHLAAYVALDAIETCARANDMTRACVVDALQNMNLETTPLGLSIVFDANNQAEGSFSLFQIENGGFNLIQ